MGSTGRLCEEDCLETALKGIGGGGEPCIKRQIIPDCGCKVAEDLAPTVSTITVSTLMIKHSFTKRNNA